MLNCCFFENTDEPSDAAAELLKNDPEMNNNSVIQSMSVIERERGYQFKSPQDLHELHLDRLQFFIDSIALLEERHVKLFQHILFNPKFKKTIFKFLDCGETNLRLKCHEILESVATYFVTYYSSKTLYELPLDSKP